MCGTLVGTVAATLGGTVAKVAARAAAVAAAFAGKGGFAGMVLVAEGTFVSLCGKARPIS